LKVERVEEMFRLFHGSAGVAGVEGKNNSFQDLIQLLRAHPAHFRIRQVVSSHGSLHVATGVIEK
jgi:hypothetical protein